MTRKKPQKGNRNTMAELVAQVDLEELQDSQPEQLPAPPTPAPKPAPPPVPEVRSQKTKSQKSNDSDLSILEKIQAQQAAAVPKTTRITLDLDPDTYRKLEQLCEVTGLTKAKLLRSLIHEVAKPLQ